jgi:GH43 family beta-xylosidase
MPAYPDLTPGAAYLNPVHDRPCPDPFVLKYGGEYWCYCTGFRHDGRCFGVLHSRDLVHWRELSGAMEPLPGGATCYWAPEVWYENGRFYMYYSVGNEERMQIRVAVAEHPAGPFSDSGRRLTTEDFAIDPHVFEDDDGSRYLFYATDFLEHTHIGTGTVYDRMIDLLTLAGQPRPVTRARFEWQVYDPQRAEKGGVRWYTVEGPCVLKHKGRYYQMFSGGNWKNVTYGVSYAMSQSMENPHEWRQVCDGERVLPILRTLPGLVVGPGHNSVVRGPDNQQLFCIYHLWSPTGGDRVLAIDRLDWAGDRMMVLGPSVARQAAPLLPTFADFFDEEHVTGLGQNWECVGGHWMTHAGTAMQTVPDSSAEARCQIRATGFALEVSLRALADPTREGAFGIRLYSEGRAVLRFDLVPGSDQAVIGWEAETGWTEQQARLPERFKSSAYHLLRLEVNGALVSIAVDGATVRWQDYLGLPPTGVALHTENVAAAFTGFALTVGWQDLFMQPGVDPAKLGWRTTDPDGTWKIEAQQLWHTTSQGPRAVIVKLAPLDSYELVVNARLGNEVAADGGYGFYPALGPDGQGPLVTVERQEALWAMVWRGASETAVFPLPVSFDPFIHQQFRFRKERDRLTLQWAAQELGEIEASLEATWVGLYAHKARAAFDMVRATALMPSPEGATMSAENRARGENDAQGHRIFTASPADDADARDRRGSDR